MNEILELLKSRSSLRKYENKPISRKDLDYILEGAMRAPTAGNMMMYSILVIEDQEKKEILSHTCDNQPFIANAPTILIFVADFQKWHDYYRYNGVEEYCKKNDLEFNRPSEGSLFLALGDAIIAAQNAVIAAESIGVGSCYIGDIVEHYEEHKKLLNLPDYAFPAAMLCLGYYPEGLKLTPKPRFDKKYIVFNEEYKSLNSDEIKDMYSSLNNRFSSENKYKAENYAQMHYAFKTGSDFSEEMARSMREIIKIWNGNKL